MAAGGRKPRNLTVIIFFSSLSVLLAGLSMLYFASYRHFYGGAVRGAEMLLFAAAGLVMSMASARKIRGFYRKEARASLFFTLRKTLSSALVIAGAIVGLIVMFESLTLFRDSARALLGAGRPKNKNNLFKNAIQKGEHG
jgi:Co/Zn/Cd efflux system component